MAHSTPPDRTYFDLHRKKMQLIASLEKACQFDSEAESIAQHIKTNNPAAATEELYRLRDSVNETVQQLFKRLRAAYERVHVGEINNLVQQQQELEHGCIVAESDDDHAAAEKFRQGLAWYDDFFAAQAAIADLNPDAVVAGP
jgi:hypothetical protein